MAQDPTVVLVWHDGGSKEYREEHALVLATAVCKHWPLGAPPRIVLLSNTELTDPRWAKFPRAVERRPLERGLTGWWNKLEVCDAQHDDLGAVLYFDLDTMVVRDLTNIIEALTKTSWPILLQDFYQLHRTNSGMMGLSLPARQDIRAWWTKPNVMYDPPAQRGILTRWRGDGDFLDAHYRDTASIWQKLLPGAVQSYKVHVRQVRGEPIPPQCAVLCFHGHPRPWQSRLWPQYLKDLGL